MPKFTVETDSKLAPKDAYARVKTFLSSEEEMKKIDPKLDCSFDDNKLCGKANGSQFKADIKVTSSANGSKVAIEVDIPFLLAPFKGKITETLQRKIGKILG